MSWACCLLRSIVRKRKQRKGAFNLENLQGGQSFHLRAIWVCCEIKLQSRHVQTFFFFFATFSRKDSSLPAPELQEARVFCANRHCKNQIHFGRLFTFQVIIALGSTIPSLVDGQKKWAACQVDVSMTPSPQR
uniref:Uncharacterized protein n=1 Tax=Myotis myotis TaxID=51298 RepID=A0A7J7ZZH5_MYOMY|nr:hypothetical protein mMyoMyo1_009969 [Myotis myotis]